MTTAIEPSADEIERVTYAILRLILAGKPATEIARAAILAMDRRAEVVREPSNEAIARTLESIDWSGSSIGSKATLLLAIERLRASPPAPAVAVPEVRDARQIARYHAEILEGHALSKGSSPPLAKEAMADAAEFLRLLAAAPEPPATRSEEPVVYTNQGWIDAAQRCTDFGSFWVVPIGGPTEIALYRKSPATRPEAEIRNEVLEEAARIADRENWAAIGDGTKLGLTATQASQHVGRSEASISIATAIRALKEPRNV
jgi:hypothetical protein